MNKKEFLEELEERLIGISKEDKKEILQDYEEHFKVGKKKKRTEQEISKSLGEPKEIAREIRKELSNKEGDELKTEAIETWVSLKKFSKYIFNEAKIKIEEIYEKFDSQRASHWILLILGAILFISLISAIGGGFLFFLIILFLIVLVINITDKDIKHTKSRKTKNKKDKEVSAWKIILVLLFNILIFVWFWLGLFAIIISLIIAGTAMIIAGVLTICFSIFSLIAYDTTLLKDILFSSLFAGIGISLLGILFTILFSKAIQLFFKISKMYLELNQKVIRK